MNIRYLNIFVLFAFLATSCGSKPEKVQGEDYLDFSLGDDSEEEKEEEKVWKFNTKAVEINQSEKYYTFDEEIQNELTGTFRVKKVILDADPIDEYDRTKVNEETQFIRIDVEIKNDGSVPFTIGPPDLKVSQGYKGYSEHGFSDTKRDNFPLGNTTIKGNATLKGSLFYEISRKETLETVKLYVDGNNFSDKDEVAIFPLNGKPAYRGDMQLMVDITNEEFKDEEENKK